MINIQKVMNNAFKEAMKELKAENKDSPTYLKRLKGYSKKEIKKMKQEGVKEALGEIRKNYYIRLKIINKLRKKV